MTIDFRRLQPDDPDLDAALTVMRDAFEGMEGRIDPPSSINTLTLQSLSQTARTAEIWVAGTPVAGTVILTPKPSVLYIGKLAVRDRRTGLGRAFMKLAEERAAALGLKFLELESRIELIEVHATFKALGFSEVMRTTHAGFTCPTSITFRKPVL